ncbi:MAG TPA: ABC transporter permease [Vicinamibacterales bacterium]|nr:ABC transporter permease [Vicinamibacterales bacterium]
MRASLRSLAAQPGFTVVAILTIALGIAANTAIFSVVNGVLLRPLPYPDAERIVQVWTTDADGPRGSHGPPDFLEFQRRTQTLESLAGYREDALTIAPDGVDPVRVSGALVTVDYFDVFGSVAALGRAFSRAADANRNEPLAVISHETWRDTLSSDPGVVGRLLRINGVPHTVLGVMPNGFDYPLGARTWILSTQPVPPPPLDIEGDLLAVRGVHYFLAVGRVRDGATVQQAQAELDAVAFDLQRRYPSSNAGRGVRIEPLHDRIVGDVRQALLMLLGAVAVVLLIACANVASLLLARASGRQRELAIRTALGASRARLIRQLLVESLVLGVVGGLFGLLLGVWAIDLLVAIIPEGVPRIQEIGLDVRVAAAALLVSLVSAMLFGLVPSLQASKGDSSAVLRDGGDRGATAGRRRARTRAALVVVEVALTLVLLVSAGLLANSFLRLQRVDPGFAAERVTLVQMPLPQGKYTDGKAQAAFYQTLLEGLKGRGEIEMAAVAFPNPLQGASASGSFDIEGRPSATRAERRRANLAAISPDYLRTMGIALISGRHFTEQDRDPAPTPIIVNAVFARRNWPGEDPLGKRVRFDETKDEWLTVVGVAADSRNKGLATEPEPLMYLPYHAFTLPFMSVVARSAGGAAAVASAVRAEVRRLDPELPIDSVRPLEQIVDESVAEPRFRTMLLGVFALTALVLAAIGVYGLISYSVAQRTREIGIRVALGARPAQVMGPIVREGLVLALLGVSLGLAGALAATKVLAAFLFGVDATDPLTFAAVAALLLIVALLASYIPSRRALKIDPLTALRAE